MTIKEARVNAGITAEQAADHVGWSKSQIYRWESGKAIMPYPVRDELCKLYGVNEKDVVYPKDYAISREKMMEVEAALICAYGFQKEK